MEEHKIENFLSYSEVNRILLQKGEHNKELSLEILESFKSPYIFPFEYSELRILPGFDRSKTPDYLHPDFIKEPKYRRPIIEIMGLPESGKTRLNEFLRKQYPDSLVIDEEKILKTKFLISSNSVSLMTRLDTLDNLIEQRKQTFYEYITQKGLCKINSPIFITRGPNDIIAFNLYSLFFEEYDEIYHKDPLVIWKFKKSLINAVGLLNQIDAVIVFDNDLEIAKQRRKKQGKTEESKIVNKEIFPIVSNGYRWWLAHIYPLLHRHYQTGLLGIDGTKPLKNNNLRVKRYIDSLIKKGLES
jgi:hypothetical protein